MRMTDGQRAHRRRHHEPPGRHRDRRTRPSPSAAGTHARAARRIRRRRRRRPAGRHPHRARPRPHRRRRRRHGDATRVADWMTAEPRLGRARTSTPPTAFASLVRARLPPHPGRRRRRSSSGIVSMRDLMRIAQIQPAEQPRARDPARASRASSSPRPTIGDVRGLEGFYHYRQYDAVELAEKRTLEDVWYLLFEGELPVAAPARRVPRRDRAAPRDPGRR